MLLSTLWTATAATWKDSLLLPVHKNSVSSQPVSSKGKRLMPQVIHMPDGMVSDEHIGKGRAQRACSGMLGCRVQLVHPCFQVLFACRLDGLTKFRHAASWELMGTRVLAVQHCLASCPLCGHMLWHLYSCSKKYGYGQLLMLDLDTPTFPQVSKIASIEMTWRM